MANLTAEQKTQLPVAAIRMLLPYFEAMDRTGRKWFVEKLKKLRVECDFNFPNGKAMDQNMRVPDRLIITPNDR